MQSIEQIVRPFQSPAVISTRRIVSNSTKIPTDDVLVEFGAAGDMPAAEKVEDAQDDGGVNFQVVTCDDKYSEKDRRFKTVRIENPDNPENYVMVARINEIKFNKRSEGENMTMYNNSATTFVPVPMYDNNNWFKNDENKDKCAAAYSLKNPE
jgi:sensor domain CHASE-containing protein